MINNGTFVLSVYKEVKNAWYFEVASHWGNRLEIKVSATQVRDTRYNQWRIVASAERAGGLVQNILSSCPSAVRTTHIGFSISILYRPIDLLVVRVSAPGWRSAHSPFSLRRNEKRAFYKYCRERDTLKSATDFSEPIRKVKITRLEYNLPPERTKKNGRIIIFLFA